MNFSDFAHLAGLLIEHTVADGRWHRCPTELHPRKKNGSWKLAPDGLIGWCQAFDGGELRTWRPDKADEPVKIDFAAIERRKAQARRDLVRATQLCRQFYLSCKPLRDGHEYLKAHGLDMTGCFGLKVDQEGWLVVPVLKDRNLMSVQRIAPNGTKRFWAGASVAGASYIIDRRQASLTALCEGLATGLAVFAAVPLVRVVVAFDAGNMVKVAEQLPRRGLVVIAADNDYVTEARTGRNPGMKAAREAAEILGCGVAAPTGITGTDWADYAKERFKALAEGKLRASEMSLRRDVHAEINAALMREARFLHPLHKEHIV